MRHHAHLRLAVWPAVIVCVFLVVGCQDGAGPNLVTSPEGKPDYDAVKPPPPPPPQPPADPAIAFYITGRVRADRGWRTAWYLKVMNADGTNLTSIYMTPPGQSIGPWHPTWSPDGRCIAFYIQGTDRGIYLIDVGVVNGVSTGTNLRLFLPYPATEPAWSPNGERIAYAVNSVICDDGGELRVIPVSGGASELLYTSSTECIGELTWNHNGTKIGFEEVVAGTPVARVLDLTDMTVTTVVGPEWGEAYPSLAHAHDAIAFTGPDPVTGLSGLTFTKELPSGTPTLVCAGRMPDWSPDDGALVYAAGHTIMKVTLGTGVITQLMSSGSEDTPRHPTWRRFF